MQAEDFAPLAREFTILLNRAAEMRPYDLLVACASLLPRIYTAGLNLPEVEPDDASSPEPVPHPSLPSLGRFDIYSEVYDPYVHVEPVMASLALDLAEIYSDLAGPLHEFDAGRIANAIWSWRFNLRGHCGDHLVDALRAIHRAVHDHMPSDYDPDEP
jgi:Domain of unknown function (DUF5063)